MKKFILILVLVLSSVSTFAQVLRDSINWNTPYYTIIYSEKLEQPKQIWYSVACPYGTASRVGMDFYGEKGIKTSDNKDYEANEWDKGHMVPAASLNCDRNMLWATFSYMNCALQQQSLNRGVWKKLEIQERELSKVNNNVKVYIKVEFDSIPKHVPAGAAIPKAFYKEIIVDEKTKFCYYFLNIAPKSNDLNTFKCNCR
jgi:DNA/RNA endonuclease G (NUC1)